ncbi:ABC transporter permease [Paenibacillus rigui]|uniref:D-ala-D-ala transporter subunit n=1 Tax=Paenibacillus rigui TaxID=554312 RepID=A0A229US20_9BACL|nr:ABC transporter permease [Paenibacillus rigui]OXM86218.1 D-ala-D-ala transporter subunit [Paenibacillus rigui]
MKEVISVKTVWQGRKLERGSLTKSVKQAAVSELFVIAAALIVLFIVICAIVPGWIAPYAPTQMFTDRILQPPGGGHWLGTDYFGRDVFSLVVYGSRDSLFIGVASVLAGGLIGGTLGALSGYVGGWLDAVLMRFIDILMTIPGILLALAIAAALGPHLFNIVFAVAVSAVPGYARVMRGQIMSIKNRPFVMASRSIGTSRLRMFWWHVLPNAWSPLLVMATIGLGSSILIGSGLSFLGLGVIKEIPDWGTLLSQGRGYLTVAWWICTFPGMAITLFVLSVNLLGDQFRDATDPKKIRG